MYVLHQVPHVGTNHVSVRVADVRSDKRTHARSDVLPNNKPQPFAFGQTHHASTDIGSHGLINAESDKVPILMFAGRTPITECHR